MKEQIRREDQPKSDKSSSNWKLNFGLMVAGLYDDNILSGIAYSELGDSVTEISSKYAHTDEFESKVMLPEALGKLFDEHAEPKLQLRLVQPVSRVVGFLGTFAPPGDLGEFAKRLIIDLDKMATLAPGDDELSPRDLRSWDNCYAVQIFLLRDDGEDFKLWQRPLKEEAIGPLFAYLNKLKNPTKSKPQHWSKRLGKLIARLGRDLDGTVKEEIGTTTVELINDYASGGYEQTRALLPLVFKKLLSEPEKISVTYGSKDACEKLFSIKEGDIYGNLETLLIGLNEICKPYTIAELDDLSKEEKKDLLILSINLEEEDLDPVTVHKQIFPQEALPVLQKFVRDTFKPVEAKDGFTPAYRLSEYKGISLDFYAREDGDAIFSFEFLRRVNDSEEVQIDTYGQNPTTLSRDGYSIPLRDKNYGKSSDNITLPKEGRIDFLGRRDKKAFSLIWRTIDGHFEAEFLMYGESDSVVQTLSILEA